ncbi:hypothetical protein H6P81_012116 [Aristolochia fimbriata]|uniref:Uncharacterized protein n=1 Tax=Aristolochia fimbriata TaxID=158543 RepID=A0AAV7EB10_ARIFI|nr:hypothetical protein H6P81_012116 [Aristolochia fimbriata]
MERVGGDVASDEGGRRREQEAGAVARFAITEFIKEGRDERMVPCVVVAETVEEGRDNFWLSAAGEALITTRNDPVGSLVKPARVWVEETAHRPSSSRTKTASGAACGAMGAYVTRSRGAEANCCGPSGLTEVPSRVGDFYRLGPEWVPGQDGDNGNEGVPFGGSEGEHAPRRKRRQPHVVHVRARPAGEAGRTRFDRGVEGVGSSARMRDEGGEVKRTPPAVKAVPSWVPPDPQSKGTLPIRRLTRVNFEA